jgi:superfamily II DNA or RNA helicase
MSASPKGKGDKSDVILEALFGPVLVDIHYSDAVRSGNVSCIKVHMYEVNATEIPRKTPVSYDRHNIWRNSSRNYIIANKAQKYLKQYGQVLILVDRVEHMLYLHKLLPNAVCVCSKLSKDQEEQFRSWKLLDDDFVLQDKDEVRRKCSAGEIPLVMSTIFKEGVDFPELPVVIRCDGGGNPISGTQMKGRLSRITDSKTEGILVDFYDGFSTRLQRRSDARISQYREDGAEVERMQP